MAAHYSAEPSDIEYLFPMGWSERRASPIDGLRPPPSRRVSGEKLDWTDRHGDRRALRPVHVIEPSAGADRGTLAFIVDAFDEEEVSGRQRTVLRLHPRLAPVKVAVLPLVSRDGMPEKARRIYEELRA